MKTPTSRLGDPELPDEHAQHCGRVDQQVAEEAETGEDEGEQGAAEGDPELLAGLFSFPVDFGHSAQQVEGDAAYGESVVAGCDAVGEFVDEHGHVQQHGEEERYQVGGGAEVQDAVDDRLVEEGEQHRDHHPGRGDVDRDAPWASDA